jgi:signal transduction histidine kinase
VPPIVADRADSFLRAIAVAVFDVRDGLITRAVAARPGAAHDLAALLVDQRIDGFHRHRSYGMRYFSRGSDIYLLASEKSRPGIGYVVPLSNGAAVTRSAATLAERLRPQIEELVSVASLLQSGADLMSKRYGDYAAEIAKATTHLNGVVAETGRPVAVGAATTDSAELAEVAAEARAMLATRALDGGVTLREVDANGDLRVGGNAQQLRQILVNLIGNAIKFTQNGGSVGVVVRRRANCADAVVWDNGPGIEPAEHEAVFSKFGRGGDATADGSGLGLHIARQLARDMGGDITLDSAAGRGCRFTLSLPLA